MSSIDTYKPPAFHGDIDLDLSRNEGRPWPLSDTAPAIDLDAVSRYPDTTKLRLAVAARHEVDVDRVLVTAGGDDALARCFLSRAGETVATTTPTFEMIRRYSLQTGGSLIQVKWWDEDFPIGEFVESAGSASMAVVVSPNNPTGNVVPEADLRKIADAFGFVVLDAAYADFADYDTTETALARENVVVIHTLSKAYGLAGLRVGYLLGAPDVVAEVAAHGSPYPVSGPSARLAEEALARDPAEQTAYLDGIRSRRDRLVRLLHELGAEPLASQANFVLAADVDPSWLVPAAASLGVGLRVFPGRSDLGRCVRITVPTSDNEMARLSATLRSVMTPEALLLDLDGVLADVSDSYLAATIGTAAHFGAAVTATDVAEAKAAGRASDDWELTRRLCETKGVDVAIEDVVTHFQQLYDGVGGVGGLSDRERPLLDAETLVRWATRLPVAVVTGRPRREAQGFLERHGLAGALATVVTREDAPDLKPDPAPVRLAMSLLGVSSAWLVGDTRDDISAARAAGVGPIGVVAPGDPPEIARRGLGGAALVLDAVDRLEEVLDAQNI